MTGKADLTDTRVLNPKVSRRTADALQVAMQVDPDDRYQTAAEFRRALIECGEMSAFFRERPTISPPPMDFFLQKEGEVAGGGVAPGGNRLKSRPSARRRRARSNPWLFIPLMAIIVAGAFIALQLQPDLPRTVLAYFGGPPAVALTPVAPSPTESLATQTPEGFVAEQPTPPPEETTIAAVEDSATPEPSLTPSPTITPSPTPTPLGGGVSEIAFASKRTGLMQIWSINANGKGLRQITSMQDGACQPVWSPDGQRLAFISPCLTKREYYEGSSIYIINHDGSGLIPLPASPEGDFDPSWSPDGTKIAFTSLRTGRASIFVIDLQTLAVKEISQSRFSDLQPAWSPNSHQIAFVRKIVFGQIWIMDAEGNSQLQFSPNGEVNNFAPTWTREGEVIFYNQLVGGSKVPGLVGMRYEDRLTYREFKVPANTEVDLGPIGSVSVSPDGFWLAYEGWPDGTNHDIYLMTINGANVTRLTTDPAFEFAPAWRPEFAPPPAP